MIEKILSEIQKLILQNEEGANACYPSAMARESAYYECKEIVQKVAKEYGKETNVRSNGWVPCSERLPEAHKNVLVCENDGEIHLCRYNGNMKRFFYDGSDWDIKLGEVIAWQPLPAPYQKGE